MRDKVQELMMQIDTLYMDRIVALKKQLGEVSLKYNMLRASVDCKACPVCVAKEIVEDTL